MFARLTIQDPRERWLVGVADLALSAVTLVGRVWPSTDDDGPPRRILLLRLERIGDLLMTIDAIARVRAYAPTAEIDLVVGSWNAALARLIPGIDRVETLDAPWLARDARHDSRADLVRRAVSWRSRRYDLAINFEGDIRSNLLLALSGARRRAGFAMAGGGPVLTDPAEHRPRAHVSANAMRLVNRAFRRAEPAEGTPPVRLALPDEARRSAAALLNGAARPIVGVHVAGGRAVKEWSIDRFADVASRLARKRHATVVLTGGPGDRALVDRVRRALDPRVQAVDVAGQLDLIALAAVLERLDLLITGDTGPMHLAAAVGTPLVAIFGPSDPARYGPLAARARIVRVDLPCSPCNRIRTPPARCVGHVPDCLTGVSVAQVLDAALDLLGDGRA